MMKKTLLVGLILAGLVAEANATPGAYMNGSLGIGGMDTDKTSIYNSNLRSGIAYRAGLGYLWGEDQYHYGLELGYTGYPSNQYTSSLVNIKYTGYYVDLLGVGKYNFTSSDEGFFVLGKAGLAFVSQRTHATGIPYNKTQTALKPEVALGAGYNVNKNVAVDMTFAHVFGGQANPAATTDSAATRVSAVNTLMAGITYSFS